jgi:hypothetical protein
LQVEAGPGRWIVNLDHEPTGFGRLIQGSHVPLELGAALRIAIDFGSKAQDYTFAVGIGAGVFRVDGCGNRKTHYATDRHTHQDVVSASTQVWGIEEFAFPLKEDFLGGRAGA